MQQSNALRKIDEDSLVPLSEEDNEPKFGDRSYYKKKKTFEQLSAPKVDNPYAPQQEAGIRWNDPDLAIEWPIAPKEVLTSEKDLKQPLLKDAECFE